LLVKQKNFSFYNSLRIGNVVSRKAGIFKELSDHILFCYI